MSEDDEQQREELLKSIQEEKARKDLIKGKLDVAGITNKKVIEELENVKRQRDEEATKMGVLKCSVEDVARAEKHAASLLEKTKQELGRKDVLAANFRQMAHLQRVNLGGNPVRWAEYQLDEFKTTLINAPWVPEKQKLRQELAEHQYNMGLALDQVERCEEELAVLKKQLKLHQKYPFTNFCVMLATYHQKSDNLRRLMEREMMLNRKLEAKVRQMQRRGNEMCVDDDGAAMEKETKMEREEEDDDLVFIAEFTNCEQQNGGEHRQQGQYQNQNVRSRPLEEQEDDDNAIAQQEQQREQQDTNTSGMNMMRDLSDFLNEPFNTVGRGRGGGGTGSNEDGGDDMPLGASVTQQNFLDMFGGDGGGDGGSVADNSSFNLEAILGGMAAADGGGKAADTSKSAVPGQGGMDFFKLFGDGGGAATKSAADNTRDDFVLDFNFG